MGPVFFPVRFEEVAARTSFHAVGEPALERDGIRITGLRMRHPSHTVGYGIEVEGTRICYVPDNEIEGGGYPVDGSGWRRRLDAFVADADLLVHDAMFTDEEYPLRRGWGHSTFRQAFDLAVRNRVGRLLLFHHAPERSDDELARIVSDLRERSERIGGPRVEAAREGEEILLTEG
jgi:phosphoribosyl 1,2-cyclic phosphodiesterase